MHRQRYFWRFYFIVLLGYSLSGCHPKATNLESLSFGSSKGLAISTAEPVASDVAAKIFRSGGNIVDASVAAALAICVVRPQSVGLGGGGFLLYHSGNPNKSEIWDFREVAPRKATAKMYIQDGQLVADASLNGPRAAGVPGLLAGLYDFQRKYGRLPWKKIVEPSIDLAEKGVQASSHLAQRLVIRKEILLKDPSLASIFFKKGRAIRAGETFVQQDLALTLRQIAAKGKKYFYRGEFADHFAAYMKESGGLIEKADLENYHVRMRKPIAMKWRNYTVLTMPPPSSGGIKLLQVLRIVDEIPESFKNSFPEKLDDGASAGIVISEIEAFKRAFADGGLYVGDPDFVKVPTKKLLDASYLEKRAYEIEYDKIVPSADVRPFGTDGTQPKQTTHLSFMDSNGNAVSMTISHNFYWGAGVVVPGTGVILNDTMDDFTTEPGKPNATYGLLSGEANKIAPGKRPVSSMTPTILLDAKKNNQVVMVLGAPGGATIPAQLHYVLTRILRDHKPMDEAIAACRFTHQWMPDKLKVEPNCRREFRALEKYYSIDEMKAIFGEVQVVGHDDHGLAYSLTDPRGGGKPLIAVH